MSLDKARLEDKAFAQLSDSVTQAPSVTTPVEITFDTNDEINKITHSETVNPADITIQKTGKYVLFAAPQVGRTSGAQDRDFDLWFRVNDVDVSNSNVRVVITKTTDKDVIISQFVRSFVKGDKINVMMSVSATGEGLGIEVINPSGEPRIPSIIFTMHQI